MRNLPVPRDAVAAEPRLYRVVPNRIEALGFSRG